jgi:hypothetical protein
MSTCIFSLRIVTFLAFLFGLLPPSIMLMCKSLTFSVLFLNIINPNMPQKHKSGECVKGGSKNSFTVPSLSMTYKDLRKLQMY